MKHTQHTPGPWAYKLSQPTATLQIRSAGEPIAHVYGPDRSENKPYFTERGAKTIFGADCERSEANARLIAAAPDLLAALQAALAWAKEVPAPYREFPFITQARAAIAKATG